MTEEEQVIRDWLDGQLSPSGAPLSPARRRSQPLPRRQVVAVVATLIELLDEAREAGTGPAPRAAQPDLAVDLGAGESRDTAARPEALDRALGVAPRTGSAAAGSPRAGGGRDLSAP